MSSDIDPTDLHTHSFICLLLSFHFFFPPSLLFIFLSFSSLALGFLLSWDSAGCRWENGSALALVYDFVRSVTGFNHFVGY